MLKACPYCGRIHQATTDCPKKPHRHYKKTATDALRNTYRWKKKRAQIRDDAHNMCEVCKAQGRITTQGLEIHHITKLRDNPNGLTDDANLVCLCVEHHKQADAGDIKPDYLRKLAQLRNQQ